MNTLKSYNKKIIDIVFISILKPFVISFFFFVHLLQAHNTKKQIRQIILKRIMKF
jgi:hypothetical protein